MRFLLSLLFIFSSTFSFGMDQVSQLDVSTSHETISAGETGYVYVTIEMPDGWHTYYKDPGDVGTPIEIEWEVPDGVWLGEFEWPEPEEFETFGLINRGYHDSVTLRLPFSVSGDEDVVLKGEATWLVCEEACIPQKQSIRILQDVGAVSVLSSNIPEFGAEKVSLSFIWILIYAFLGGLILNVMPCVLPVLSLKALELVKKDDLSDARRHAWSYTAGIVSTFMVLALVLVILRIVGLGLGWGFHLQSPVFVGVLAVVMLLVGLNLLGVFPVPMWVLRLTSVDGTGRSSFYTGVLATVVATPCTAPFMATALGLALTLPLWQGFSTFAMLGLGMAFPFLLLSYVPSFQRVLPKPGAWMETFKKILSVPMFATVVWLLWVLYSQVSFQPSHTGEVFDEARIEQYLAEGRPVFVDVTAAWCLTCQVNEKGVLSSRDVQAWFEDNGVVYMVADWTSYDADITSYLESFDRNGVPLYVYYHPGQSPKVLPQILTVSDIVMLP